MNAEIRSLGDPDTHFWLTRSVARVMGLNLSEAINDGTLSVQGYADLVKRCRTCPRVAECHEWLAKARQARAAAPTHCMNHQALARIAAQHAP